MATDFYGVVTMSYESHNVMTTHGIYLVCGTPDRYTVNFVTCDVMMSMTLHYIAQTTDGMAGAMVIIREHATASSADHSACVHPDFCCEAADGVFRP